MRCVTPTLRRWKCDEVRECIKESRPAGRWPGFFLKIKLGSLEKSRIVIVAPKSIGSAPKRNRIKRRFREAFYLSSANLTTSVDLIVFVRGQRAATEPFTLLTTALTQALTGLFSS